VLPSGLGYLSRTCGLLKRLLRAGATNTTWAVEWARSQLASSVSHLANDNDRLLQGCQCFIAMPSMQRKLKSAMLPTRYWAGLRFLTEERKRWWSLLSFRPLNSAWNPNLP